MAGEGNRNAYLGHNIETLFRNSINDYPSVIEAIKAYFKIDGEFLNAGGGGIHGEKSDVRLNFASGHFIDANIKAYKDKAGFNQLARTTASKFCELFSLDDNMKKDLENILVEKSKNTKNQLFDAEAIERWDAFIKNNAKDIIKWGFANKAAREIVVLYDRDKSLFRIYPMSDVLKKLSTSIEFTKGGFNIGKCISFQRKGGNGSLSKTISKYDINHPGNNVQLKRKVKKFVELMESVKIGEYKI